MPEVPSGAALASELRKLFGVYGQTRDKAIATAVSMRVAHGLQPNVLRLARLKSERVEGDWTSNAVTLTFDRWSDG